MSMIRVLMGTQSRTSRTVGRPISSGLGPSLLLAVAVMVLASGGVSSVRVLGSAGVGLAMTVISDRAIAMSAPREQDGTEFARPVEFCKLMVVRAPATDDARTCWMVRAGCLDLPPPAFVLS
ncbi:MAG: hypothetical protein COB69_09335 [Phycisphaera sp.]|nr:MAG: hypothetical protein COB69_09335 [Phycisphaera sp.]